MNNGYEFVPPKPSRFMDIHHLCREANLNYCWIFNKTSRKWWTASEFYDEFHKTDFNSLKMINFLEDISIRNPMSGITAAYKQFDELNERHKKETQELIDRVEAFNQKVIKYYQDKEKPRL